MYKMGEERTIDCTFSFAEDFLTDTLPRALEHQPPNMRPLPMGIYTPLPCFFGDNEEIGETDMV